MLWTRAASSAIVGALKTRSAGRCRVNPTSVSRTARRSVLRIQVACKLSPPLRNMSASSAMARWSV